MFDLVIQGPLDNTSLQYVGKYHPQFKNIIVSHWEEDLTDSVKSNYNKLSDWKIVKGDYGGQYKPLAQITSQPLPDLNKTFFTLKDSTFFYSLTSTYAGLKKCTSPYVVKMRSDEHFTNFKALKEKFLNDTNKLVCGNIFFKNWNFKPYHIGDHLFVSKRESLLRTYETLLDVYEGKRDEPWAHHSVVESNTAEEILAKSYLTTKEAPRNTWADKKTLLKYFDVVDINQLSPYVAQWQHAGKTYSSDGVRFAHEPFVISDIKHI